MNSILENLKVLLANVDKIKASGFIELNGEKVDVPTGLCRLTYLFVAKEEQNLMKRYLTENRPKTFYSFIQPTSSYWWKRGEIRPRKRWLKKQIKLLEKFTE